jgi:serine/threonine protein kinase
VENTRVGPFLIVKKLGSRRQNVYHARQTEQNRDVALKFIKIPPSIDWPKALEKIEREVKELQKLQHPNLVKVYGAGVHEEKVFFANELIKGESLSSILSRRGKLTPDLVVEYGRQIAELLRYLHAQDLIHSKLTPEKILVTEDHRIKVADLRLNRSKRRRWDSTRRRELDIAAYMAPEQFKEGATQKSDFYSLGVILYEMLTGKLPYPPDTMGRMTQMKMNSPVPSVAEQMMNCPIWLDKIVSQMLSPNPKKRPHSARAISLVFEEIKNIDATQKSAASQMVGGFNALNAGQDKSEARRLLGIKKKKKNRSSDTPFFQQIWFQILVLVLIVATTVYKLTPVSDSKMMEQARAEVHAVDSSQWSKGRSKLQPIMNGNGEFAEEAEELYYESRRKALVMNAEAGIRNGFQNEDIQSFGKAVRFQQDERYDDALSVFMTLVQSVDPDGTDRHIHAESKARLEALTAKERLPQTLGELTDLIAKAKKASTSGQRLAAHELLARIVYELSGKEEYQNVVKIANEQLLIVKKQIANQAKAKQEDNPDGENLDAGS